MPPILPKHDKAKLWLNLCITTRCNRMCPSCCVGVGRFPERDMTVQEVLDLGKIMGSVPTVQITGGEPMVRPHVATMVSAAHRAFNTKDVRLYTNGDHLIPAPMLPRLSMVTISHYTKDTYPGCDDNQAHMHTLIDWIKAFRWETRGLHPVIMVTPPLKHEQGVSRTLPCFRAYNNSVSYWDGLLYPCCSAHGAEGRGIPVTKNWRDEIMKIGLPCVNCTFGGKVE